MANAIYLKQSVFKANWVSMMSLHSKALNQGLFDLMLFGKYEVIYHTAEILLLYTCQRYLFGVILAILVSDVLLIVLI